MATAQAVHMRCFNPGFIWWLSIAVGDRVAIYRQDAGTPSSVSGLPLPVLLLLFLFEGVDNVEWLVGNEKKGHIVVLGSTMFHFHSFWKPDKAAGSK